MFLVPCLVFNIWRHTCRQFAVLANLPTNRCVKHLDLVLRKKWSLLKLFKTVGQTIHEKKCFHTTLYFLFITSWITSFTSFSPIVPLSYRCKHLNIILLRGDYSRSFSSSLFSKHYSTHTVPLFVTWGHLNWIICCLEHLDLHWKC